LLMPAMHTGCLVAPVMAGGSSPAQDGSQAETDLRS
jgi:hypothetical protein